MHLTKTLALWLFLVAIHSRGKKTPSFLIHLFLGRAHSFNKRQKPQLLDTNYNVVPQEETLLAPHIPQFIT